MKKLFLLIIFGTMMLTSAQAVTPEWPLLKGKPPSLKPAWIRLGKNEEMWKKIQQSSFAAPRINKELLSISTKNSMPLQPIKTTVPNWLNYRLLNSGVFSRSEKEILQKKPENLVATMGKLEYFQDRSTLLLSYQREEFPEAAWDENAYNLHQSLLAQTRREIVVSELREMSQRIASWLSPEDREKLLLSDAQPMIFVITRDEVQAFTTMSLAEQQAFAMQKFNQAQGLLAQYLNKEPGSLEIEDFRMYYFAKGRARYFKLLYRVLQNATQPRPSIVVRVRETIDLPFLPSPNEVLTDAERLGKLYWYTMGDFSQADKAALTQELERQNKLYRTYAEAEVFHIPYHRLLDLYSPKVQIEDIFGQEEGQRLENLDPHQAPEILDEKIRQITQAQDLKRGILAPTARDYKDYFLLQYQKEFCSALKVRMRWRAGSSTPVSGQ